MRISQTKRVRKSSRRLPTAEVRNLFQDGRVWTQLAKVIAPDDGPHWKLHEEGGRKSVMVEVQTMPEGLDLTCRLGTCAGGPGTGLWFIPAAGAVVLVAVPSGQIDHCPVIVAVLDSGAPPDRIGDDKVVLVSTVPVEITAPTVLLGPDPGSVDPIKDGFVHGQGIDSFSGAPYFSLQNTSTKVLGNK